MQSFIIVGKDKEKVEAYIKAIILEQKISKFDVYRQGAEKSIGIADIKSLSRQIYLKPIKGNKKAVVLDAFYGITLEAQNAFLKMLEEPPLSTTIIILAKENLFLPTILSRCKLIELDKNFVLTKEDESEFLNTLENLKKANIGEKLKFAENLSKDKEEALVFLEKLILATRKQMISDNERRIRYKKIVEVLQKYYREIKESNVNLRLALENLFLEI